MNGSMQSVIKRPRAGRFFLPQHVDRGEQREALTTTSPLGSWVMGQTTGQNYSVARIVNYTGQE